MDIISFNEAATANGRIEICNANPDSNSGIVTVPKVIASGETITIPAGRVAILPNVQIDGVLNVENGGEVFIPSGSTTSQVIPRVTSTDNAIVRFDGTTGAVQNSGVTIDDGGNVGIGTSSPTFNLDVRNTLTTGTPSDNAIFQLKSSNRNSAITLDTTGGSLSGIIGNFVNGVNVSQLKFDSTGNILSILPNGGLGYGIGSGGTVTQLTSKSTAVTLNKPTGTITMNNSALAAGASVTFNLNNSLLSAQDTLHLTMEWDLTTSYRFEQAAVGVGITLIRVTNISGSSLSEALKIKFNVIKGAVS